MYIDKSIRQDAYNWTIIELSGQMYGYVLNSKSAVVGKTPFTLQLASYAHISPISQFIFFSPLVPTLSEVGFLGPGKFC